MENSNARSFNLQDFTKAATNAILVAVFASIYGVVVQEGFDVFSADWISIFSTAFNVAISTFVGFLGTNFLANKEGRLMGVKVK